MKSILISSITKLVVMSIVVKSDSSTKSHPRQWVVKLNEDQSTQEHADLVAARDGFVNRGPLVAMPNHWIFEAAEDFVNEHTAQPGILGLQSRGLHRRSVSEIHSTFDSADVYDSYHLQERKPRYRRVTPISGFKDPGIVEVERAIIPANRPPPESLDHSLAKRAPVDDDPYSKFRHYNDPLWAESWQVNSLPGNSNMSLNIFPVWKAGFTGSGVNVALIDDGIQPDHPDLIGQLNGGWSFNPLFKTNDASPQSEEDNHGTRCAGEIVGIANNQLCSAGIAHNARVTAIKIIGDKHPTDAEEATAFNHMPDEHDIYSSSWGPSDDGTALEGPGIMAHAAFEYGVRNGRKGRGSIYLFAAGNGGQYGDNCNADGYANSAYTIAVGSLDINGKLPYYGEPCAAHLIMGLGGAGRAGSLVATTDIHSKCTEVHTGTSAAAPQLAGLISLILQARPDLGWRDVQHLLVRSTVLNDRNSSFWEPNRAGFMVHPNYAFGQIDGLKFLTNAQKWKNVPTPQSIIRLDREIINVPIPATRKSSGVAAEPLRVSKIISRSQIGNLRHLEHVLVTLSLQHPRRGHLQITLIAPEARSRSVLLSPRPNDKSVMGLHEWTMSSVRHWDEDPMGEWELEIQDMHIQTSDAATTLSGGVLESWQIEFRGRCGFDEATTLPNGTLTCASGMNSDSILTTPSSNHSSSQKLINNGLIVFLILAIAVIIIRFYPRSWPRFHMRWMPLVNQKWFKRQSSMSNNITSAIEKGGGASTNRLLPIETSVRLPKPGSIRSANSSVPSSPSRPPSASGSPSMMIPLLTIPSQSEDETDEEGSTISSLPVHHQLPSFRVSGSRRYNNDPSATPLDPMFPISTAFNEQTYSSSHTGASVTAANDLESQSTPDDNPMYVPRVPSPYNNPDDLRKTMSATNLLSRIPSLPRFPGGTNSGDSGPKHKGRHIE